MHGMLHTKNRTARSLRTIAVAVVLVAAAVAWGCGSGSPSSGTANTSPAQAGTTTSAALDSTSMNLVFVVSPDLEHNDGDINLRTANLSCQGLQRAIRLASYLHDTLLDSASASGIYALAPATRLQTANNCPDMVPLEIMEQFAMLNPYSETYSGETVVGASFPVNVSYTANSLPTGAAVPAAFHARCQGIDFADHNGDNETLVNSILARQTAGHHVFSLPFTTLQTLLTRLKEQHGFGYTVPETWQGPNVLYVLAMPPNAAASSATLTSYDTHLTPGQGYPTPTPSWVPAPNNQQQAFVAQPMAVAGSSIPSTINTSETVYFIRHGEAHPASFWDDGNLVMPGDWRAMFLPTALASVIRTPDYVYAVDPSQVLLGCPPTGSSGATAYSYVRPSQTVGPYAIANGLPFLVPTSVEWSGSTAAEDHRRVEQAVDLFFTGGRFSGKTLLVAWEHQHIPPIAQSLINRYFTDTTNAPTVPSWPGTDYDTIWTFTLDAEGKLVVDNKKCEGIQSSSLPSTPLRF